MAIEKQAGMQTAQTAGLQVRASWVSQQASGQAKRLSDFGLIALDMDSTLITIECIDEIADLAGKKAEVAAITQAAMRGESTDFKDSLRRRLRLLEGTPMAVLEEVYATRLQLSPGAQTLIQACQAQGLKTLLVSGGFSFFTERLQKRLNLDFVRANVLAIENGRLTGEVVPQAWGDICDGAQKKATVEAICSELGLSTQQAIVVGDGANDLPMMSIAGLSVAYHAKPVVQAQADVAIQTGGLDRLLEVLQSFL
jgi:phosphoserine phosphatase